jgi:hypothetical protein
MPAIRKSEAVSKLAQTVDAASRDDLADIYSELFPDRPRLLPADAEQRRAEIAEHVRTKLEPEEIVDLWNLVFPAHRNVYYDDADGLLCYTEEEPRYAER